MSNYKLLVDHLKGELRQRIRMIDVSDLRDEDECMIAITRWSTLIEVERLIENYESGKNKHVDDESKSV
jgi:hypothetical protein